MPSYRWEAVQRAAHKPRKHPINIKPVERVSLDFTYDEPGTLIFHCRLVIHLEAGMFRFLNVSLLADEVHS